MKTALAPAALETTTQSLETTSKPLEKAGTLPTSYNNEVRIAGVLPRSGRDRDGSIFSAVSASTHHPFREKSALQQATHVLCSYLAVCVVIFVVLLAVLVALRVHGARGGLNDPCASALVLTLGVVGFELFTVRVAKIPALQRFLEPQPRIPSSRVSLALLHLAVVFYAVARLTLPDAAVGREILHIALLYAALLGVVALGSAWPASGDASLAELLTQVRELRTQRDALRDLLKRHEEGSDDSDGSVSTQGDLREYLIVPPIPVGVPAALAGRVEAVLPHVLGKHTFDRALALKIASRLRRPTYSLAHFYEDIQLAFPELRFYMAGRAEETAEGEGEEGGEGTKGGGYSSSAPTAAVVHTAVTSGLHADEEYRRTIGAMFAVYWLCRIGLDGERGFSFGVDEQWAPHEPDAASDATPPAAAAFTEPDKRRSFYQTQDWQRLQQLLIDAGILTIVEPPTERRSRPNPSMHARSSSWGALPLAAAAASSGAPEAGGGTGESRWDKVRVVPERAMAMLALTAFHDVMKVEALLPTVAAEHAPYLGFQTGDMIHDHDIALGYVLDAHPHLLPSFCELQPDDQRTIRFTQSKMQFNHGWLVQGEAPPAALFAKFKEVMLSEDVATRDVRAQELEHVAFYFVHWLTDLGGAEPSPLGGAEKFVLKFPHAVLDSFIRSFSVVNELAVKGETQVNEAYLRARWAERPGAGPTPQGDDSVALMRLMLHAQTAERQEATLSAYHQLSDADRKTLADEMARSGIVGQWYERGPAFKQAFGPAFLVYYAPALVRNLSPAASLAALRTLAEVYRRARQLWPLRPSTDNAHAVTIRIDLLKELKVHQIVSAFAEGDSWLVVRKNELEGVVERHRLDEMASLLQGGTQAAVLKLWRIEEDAASQSGGSGSKKSGASARAHTRRHQRRLVGFNILGNNSESESASQKSKSSGDNSYRHRGGAEGSASLQSQRVVQWTASRSQEAVMAVSGSLSA